MKTDQVSRRSASYRRRLFAAGVLSAVVALSYVGSAFAVDCPANSIDIMNADGDFDETTADSVDGCMCAIGYMPDGNGACVPCATSGTMTIPRVQATMTPYTAACGGIAPGYFGTPVADDTTDANPTPCAGGGGAYTSATQDHVTTRAVADAITTKDDCQTKPGYYLETVYDGSNDASTVTAKVAANFYGAGGVALSATTDSTVNACPENSNSEAGSVAIGDCKCDAGYQATTTGCASCPANTDWITAPSIGAATFCEAIKAGYYGTLGSGADASPTACPSGWTSAGITSGGPTSIADCFQDASGIPPGSAMYGKSGDSTNFYLCPTGTVNTAAPAAGTASFCSSLKPGYAGSAGTAGTTGSHATVTGCATGYYIDAAANFAAQSSNSDASGLVCTQVPANKYFTTTTSNPLEVTFAETPTACPSDSTSTAGSVAIGDCKCDAGYKATTTGCASCPDNTDWITAPSIGADTFCEESLAGYYAVYGNGADASPTACPENSDSAAGSTELADCECAANFYPSNNACVACATGTTREGTVSVTGTATCSGGATSPSATADSAGASTPIAVALATAAAVPLLL
jgi:hypothetical protein